MTTGRRGAALDHRRAGILPDSIVVRGPAARYPLGQIRADSVDPRGPLTLHHYRAELPTGDIVDLWDYRFQNFDPVFDLGPSLTLAESSLSTAPDGTPELRETQIVNVTEMEFDPDAFSLDPSLGLPGRGSVGCSRTVNGKRWATRGQNPSRRRAGPRASAPGKRDALGARRGSGRPSGAGLVAAGIVVGLFASTGTVRLLESFLFGVTGDDRLTLVGAPLVLAGVAS